MAVNFISALVFVLLLIVGGVVTGISALVHPAAAVIVALVWFFASIVITSGMHVAAMGTGGHPPTGKI